MKKYYVDYDWVEDTDTDNFVDPATDELLQEDHYYPFGIRINGLGKDPSGIKNKYMYNGKELQDDHLAFAPLDWYDFGFRFYDPALGRFTCLDPIAEDFVHLSPYNYADNLPIANIDLWGLQSWYAADGNVITKGHGMNSLVANDEPLRGPLSNSAIEKAEATHYGVVENIEDASFTDKEIQDFADWNFDEAGNVEGNCLGAATKGAEKLTGVDVGWENSKGQLSLKGKNVWDLGKNLEGKDVATEVKTRQGKESQSITNDIQSKPAENAVFLAGPGGAYHSIIVTYSTNRNSYSVFDQGTKYRVYGADKNGMQSKINMINNDSGYNGSKMWRLNKIRRQVVLQPIQ